MTKWEAHRHFCCDTPKLRNYAILRKAKGYNCWAASWPRHCLRNVKWQTHCGYSILSIHQIVPKMKDVSLPFQKKELKNIKFELTNKNWTLGTLVFTTMSLRASLCLYSNETEWLTKQWLFLYCRAKCLHLKDQTTQWNIFKWFFLVSKWCTGENPHSECKQLADFEYKRVQKLTDMLSDSTLQLTLRNHLFCLVISGHNYVKVKWSEMKVT